MLNFKKEDTKTRLQNGKVTSPKTASSIRTIEVNETVLKILYDYISNQEYIFNVSISTLGFNLRKYDLSTHMFRHTHVALLVEAGVPIKVISERLGHSNIGCILNPGHGKIPAPDFNFYIQKDKYPI